MIKYFETVTNTRGDSLPNYRVQVVDSAGATVEIYTDSSGTRFTDDAGNTVNYATADTKTGKAQFYWTPATGQVLQVLDLGGELVDATADFADRYVLGNLPGNIAQSAVTDLTTDLAAKAATADLASTATGKGAALIADKLDATGATDLTQHAINSEVISVKRFGALGDGVTDDTTAFQAAVANAPDGSIIRVPAGTYILTGDVTWNAARRLTLIGDGQDSELDFTSGGIIVTGATSFNRLCIEKLRIYRHGTAGKAIHIYGSNLVGVSRWVLRDLHIQSQSGTGIHIEGSWIGTMDSVVIISSATGVKVARDTEYSITSMNNLGVFGGEIQGCTVGWDIAASAAIGFFAHAVEGCGQGVTAVDTPRNLAFYNCYFEYNTVHDISVGATSTGYSCAIRDSIFFSPGGGAATDYAIRLLRGKNFIVEGNSFVGYTVAGVRVTDDTGTTTTGVARRNHLSSTPAQVSVAGLEFGDLRTVRNSDYQVTTDVAVRTEFKPFVVAVPSDISGSAALKMRFRMQTGSGDATVGYLVATTAGVTIGSGTTTSTAPTTGSVYEVSWTRDVTAYAGQNVVVNFRRVGENAADTHTGQLEYLGGEVSVRTSSPDN